MIGGYRFLLLAAPLLVASPALACEPVVPFMQVMVPALALTGSIFVLAAAVIVKSVLFAVFERRLPRLRAAWRMFSGQRADELCGPAYSSHDCKWRRDLACRSATGLHRVLATIT